MPEPSDALAARRRRRLSVRGLMAMVGLVLLTAVAAIAWDGPTPNAVHPPNDLELDD